ncbi:CpcT/CpeT family chromophore lyase [uncultured Croceitalea sp.]|uniref:CpcT/CpeT family chromophore lyase n=1 Tax=uncultured Croceitalea sp. TaxID=1798908 RepID=UPI003305DAA8
MNKRHTLSIILFIITVVFGKAQETPTKAKDKPSASAPEMGKSSKATQKRLATTVEPNRKFSYTERELDYLMHIWEGEYDNVEQLEFDKTQRKKGQEALHKRVHASVRQFQNSNFGAGAVYVEEYQNGDKTQTTRQCIYQLLPDDVEKAIYVKVFHFKEKKPILAAGEAFDEIAKLTPESEQLVEGCKMLLRRKENGFLAKTIDKNCNNNVRNQKETIDYQFSVSEDSFGFQKVRYESGRRLADDKQVSEYTLEKARCFTCMIDFPNDTNGRPTVTKYYIDIYDQGGSFEFEYPDGRQMHFGMRNTWSFGMHRETFVIYILDKATQKTLIYSWGNPSADRIGFNPGWIRAQCDLKTPRNIKLQQELRPGS